MSPEAATQADARAASRPDRVALVDALPPPRPRWLDVLGEGLAAGAIGGGAVALFFLAVDLAHGRPLWTPSLLGGALFLGHGLDQVTGVDLRMVLAYTGIHMSVFVGAGVVAAAAVALLESHPPAAVVLMLLFVGFEVAFFAFALGHAPSVLGALGSASVAVANLLASGTMAMYFARRHPLAIRTSIRRLVGR